MINQQSQLLATNGYIYPIKQKEYIDKLDLSLSQEELDLGLDVEELNLELEVK